MREVGVDERDLAQAVGVRNRAEIGGEPVAFRGPLRLEPHQPAAAELARRGPRSTCRRWRAGASSGRSLRSARRRARRSTPRSGCSSRAVGPSSRRSRRLPRLRLPAGRDGDRRRGRGPRARAGEASSAAWRGGRGQPGAASSPCGRAGLRARADRTRGRPAPARRCARAVSPPKIRCAQSGVGQTQIV